MINYKRLIISTVTGALLGIICVVGVGSRIFGGDYLGNIVYLLGIWMSRLTLGVLIGFVGDFIILPGIGWKKWVNVVIRGIFFGLLLSVTVLLLDTNFNDYSTFAAGIAYGLITDLVATFFTKEKVEKEEKRD